MEKISVFGIIIAVVAIILVATSFVYLNNKISAGDAKISGRVADMSNSYEMVTKDCTSYPPHCVVTCPAGKRLVSGGCEHDGQDALLLMYSSPYNYQSLVGWTCKYNMLSDKAIVTAYAICENGY